MEQSVLVGRAAADYAGVDYKTFRKWTRREIDPLPVYHLPGQTRYLRVFRKEYDEWLTRNAVRAN